jgi:short-subunit dehydrogenase
MKKIIIIGATSGIGRELARIYASEGHLVGVTGRRQELLYTLQLDFPNQIVTQCYDAAADDNIVHLESLIAKIGGMDILVYNAGYGEPSEGIDRQIDQTTMNTNVKGFLESMDFGFNYFLKNGQGHLVTTSSVASIRGNGFAPAYSASKAFQSIYFEGLYMKLRKKNLPIFVTDVLPGFVDTKMAKATKKFWVSSPQKAAKQIHEAIEKKKRRVYITRRWRLVGILMKWMPDFVYHRLQ